ncbi:MAG TPA: glycosyltransferase [Bacteroidia bacterium]|nr:glycosyltransferase [Bacteroidia bacterium]
MPKVLRIINRFNLGGITYNVSYLSKYLPNSYETALIGGPEEAGEESSLFIPQSLGLNPIVIEEMRRSLNPFKDLLAYRKIKKIIREFKPDIVHTHASKAGAIGRLAAKACGVPVIVHTFHGHVFHGYFSPFKTNIFKSIERYLAKKSNAIVAISKIQKKEISEIHQICEETKIHVIPLGFDLEKFSLEHDSKRKIYREKLQLKEDELALGIIGRLAPIKNHKLFVDGLEFAKKNSNHKKLKGIIIGDGELRSEIENYILSKGMSFKGENADFIFAGWEKEVYKALPGLDLVCLTSDNEGTPVSLIEAQAAGKFVVSTNVGGIQDILNPKCGFLSEKGDHKTYCTNLLNAISNFETLNKQATIAQTEVIQKFSYKRLCSEMDLLYKELMGTA